MSQLTIDFSPIRHARTGDPETSKESARRVREFAAGQCRLILDALKRYGPMTCDQIAQHTCLQSQQINKRLPDLQRHGLAMPTGEIRQSLSGRNERVWGAS